MKNASDYAKRLASLLRRLKGSVHFEAPPPRDPIAQLVLSFLQWEAPRKSAESALNRLTGALVDHNELRVSHAHEIVAFLGPRYPRAEERAARLRDALQEIFIREHATSLDSLVGRGKREVRAYLDSLPGMTPYVAAQVHLFCFGGGAVPVDDRLASLLKQEGVVDPEATTDDVASFVERQVKSEDAKDAHLLLQAWADTAVRPGSDTTGKSRGKATGKTTAGKKKVKKTGKPARG